MKKLLAILLSALMLCAMIPFATVAAADEPTIVVSTVEEANAGDEIEVLVQLQNNPGVISAVVEIEYNHDAMELVTDWVYDEDLDEDVEMNMIEVAKGWSTKYITFGPLGKCSVVFINGTASKDVTKEDFFTATFKIKDDAVSGSYDLTVNYNPKNFFNVAGDDVYFGKQDATIVVNGSDPIVPPSCEHEYDNACDVDCNLCGETREVEHNVVAVAAKDATCYEDGNLAYWYCDVCGQAWLDEACTLNTNLKAVILPMAHAEATYVAAKAATCTENGNIEYWYCADCGQAWLDAACTLNTNLKAVILAATGHAYDDEFDADCNNCGELRDVETPDCVHEYDNACDYDCNLCGEGRVAPHNILHVAAKAATCYENGNIEYWYCADCGYAWLDEACTLNTNLKAVILPMAHAEATHVAAKAPTCDEIGNIEYWYCETCGQTWLDAECTLNTNLKAVVLPIAHNVIYVAAKDATCTELGNIEYWYCADCGQAWLDELCHLNTNLKAVILPMIDHVYDDEFDADCNACGAIREVASKEFAIIANGANISPDVNGLGFLFTVNASNIKAGDDQTFQGATITIDGVEYELVELGAILTNQKEMIKIVAKYLWEMPAEGADSLSFAVRAIHIPEEYFGRKITATPYYTYKTAEGTLKTVKYSAVTVSSYAEKLAELEAVEG